MFFWGPNGHDGIWHLALDAAAFKQFPFIVPIFEGATLSGYNFLLDICIFLLSKLGIPPVVSYFKLLPLIWFPLFTWMVFMLTKKLKKSSLYTGIFLFLAYFGGSFSYIFTLWHKKSIWGSSSVLSMQAGQTLTNPQFALSLICILAILYVTVDEILTARKSMLLGLLLFLMLGLKFYGGFIALFIVGFHYLILIRRHSIVKVLIYGIGPAIGTACAVILFYYSPSMLAGSTFMFSPFAMMHAMIEDPQLFYLKDTVNARYFLQEHGWSPRLVYIELLTTALFMVFNFGLRTVGIVYAAVRASLRKISRFELTVLLSIILASGMTVMLIQRGEWWNTIQFFYYALFLANFLTAQFINDIYIKWRQAGVAVIIGIILLTIPYDLDLLHEYISFPAPAYVSNEELKALSFLRSQPDGAVLTSAYAKSRRSKYTAPYPLYAYDDTAYVPAFSGKTVYYADTVQLSLLGLPYKARWDKLSSGDCSILRTTSYIYEQRNHPFVASLKKCNIPLKRIFKNNEAFIYSITK